MFFGMIPLAAAYPIVPSVSTLDFGPVVNGEQSAFQSITITNITKDTLTNIDAILINGPGNYISNNDCPAALWGVGTIVKGDPPIVFCTINIAFSPNSVGDAPGSLSVDYSANGDIPATTTVLLSGLGLPKPTAILEVSGDLLFGNQEVGVTSAMLPLTITNTGDAGMLLNPLVTSGPFTQTSTCGSTLAAGESCSADVSFTPVASGNTIGQLSVSGVDSGSGDILNAVSSLTGVGIKTKFSLSPDNLNFDDVLPDAVSTTQSVIITNPNSVDLSIDEVKIDPPFTQTNDCGSTIIADGSCRVDVTFSPVDAGTFDSKLQIVGRFIDLAPINSPLRGKGASRGSAAQVPTTLVIALSGTTMSQGTAQDILSSVAGNLNPNIASVVVVIADTCSSGRASSRLQEDCNALIDAADDSDPGVIEALREITPERSTKSSRIIEQNAQMQISNISSRMTALHSGASGISLSGFGLNIKGQQLAATRGGSAGEAGGLFDSRLSGWVTGTISVGNKQNTDLDSGLEFQTNGITAGMDYRLNESWVVGGALGYMSTNSDLDSAGGNLDATGYTLIAYGTYYVAQSYYVDFSLTYGRNSFDQKRNLNYVLQNQGVVDQTAKANFDGNLLTASIGSGYDFNSGHWTFGPRGNLDYIKTSVDGFTEKFSDPLASGGGWAAQFTDADQTWLTLKLGGKVSYAHSNSWGVLVPYAGADWLHEFQNDAQFLQGGFAEDPDSLFFTIQNEKPDRDYFQLNLGVTAVFQNGILGFIDYRSIFSNERWDRQTYSAGLRMEF